jgi:hypothetical protein
MGRHPHWIVERGAAAPELNPTAFRRREAGTREGPLQASIAISPICSWQALPSSRLRPQGPITAAFLQRNVTNVQEAGRLLQALPYGRNERPFEPLCVLDDRRGTCSTKHALLACLAEEQGQPIQLTLGIYEMSEANTPGAGPVLDAHGLKLMLEAHCYLTFHNERIDVTRSVDTPAQPIERLLHEEQIRPDQIGTYKVQLHQQLLREWINSGDESVRGFSLDQLWQIREACIAALGQ